MILHIVLFTFKDGYSWQSPAALTAEAKSKDHPSHIQEIIAWMTGRNISDRDIAADFAVAGVFTDQAALQRYRVDPDHHVGATLWAKIATWQIIDIDLSADSCGVEGFHALMAVDSDSQD
ncbi:MAG TPA: stress responsive protein [Gammaproteobacteria bacterium]|nr:stress responsive protein [Gammaproteobacteria bacterium]